MKTSAIALGAYNPSQVPKETLLAEFTARKEMLEDLLAVIRSNKAGEPCQHSLLIGPRGFGKTTSLHALRYKVEDDPELKREWVPLLFDEENYQIADLAGLWLECLRLAETAFGVTHDGEYSKLNVSRDPRLEALALNALLELLEKHKKRELILIDNLNDILSVVNDEREQHRLRACLMEESRICIVGTASSYFEDIQNLDRPFYNLFRIFRLDRFTVEEMRTALEAMWASRINGGQAMPMQNDEGYWKGLHILTGGNPRLVKMIFQLMERGVALEFRAQLEGLLDAYTPYFKHRIEALSPQQRRVFDAIALAWNPVQISEIAPGLRMESNQISAQVRALMDAQMIDGTGGSAKKRLYQVADRFSNIYYFMRYSRAGRSKFEWFVLTMKAILSPGQYRTQMDRIREQGLACETEMDRLEQVQLLASATRMIDDVSERRREGHKSVEHFLTHDQEAALKRLLDDPAMKEVLRGEHAAVKFFSELPKAKTKNLGYKPDCSRWWHTLGDFAVSAKQMQYAEQAYRKAIVLEPKNAQAWYNLAVVLHEIAGEEIESELAYRKAIELDPMSTMSMCNLSILLAEKKHGYDEAETLLRRCIKIDPNNGDSWYNLGKLLGESMRRFEEAGAAYRTAIQLNSKDAAALVNLASLQNGPLDKPIEAETSIRKAIELDPKDPDIWYNFANIQRNLGHFAEAESSYREAINLNPNDFESLTNLASLLAGALSRFEEAEVTFRRAILLGPNQIRPKLGLFSLLILRERLAEALSLAEEMAKQHPEEVEVQTAFFQAVGKSGDPFERVFSDVARRLSRHFFEKSAMTDSHVESIHRFALQIAARMLALNMDKEVRHVLEVSRGCEVLDVVCQAMEVRSHSDTGKRLSAEKTELVTEYLRLVQELCDTMTSAT